MPSNINHVPRVHTQQGKSGPGPGSRAFSIGPVAAPSAGTAPLFRIARLGARPASAAGTTCVPSGTTKSF